MVLLPSMVITRYRISTGFFLVLDLRQLNFPILPPPTIFFRDNFVFRFGSVSCKKSHAEKMIILKDMMYLTAQLLKQNINLKSVKYDAPL